MSIKINYTISVGTSKKVCPETQSHRAWQLTGLDSTHPSSQKGHSQNLEDSQTQQSKQTHIVWYATSKVQNKQTSLKSVIWQGSAQKVPLAVALWAYYQDVGLGRCACWGCGGQIGITLFADQSRTLISTGSSWADPRRQVWPIQKKLTGTHSPNLSTHHTQIKAANGKLISGPLSAAISPFVLRALGGFAPCLSCSLKCSLLIPRRDWHKAKTSLPPPVSAVPSFSHLTARGRREGTLCLQPIAEPDSSTPLATDNWNI